MPDRRERGAYRGAWRCAWRGTGLLWLCRLALNVCIEAFDAASGWTGVLLVAIGAVRHVAVASHRLPRQRCKLYRPLRRASPLAATRLTAPCAQLCHVCGRMQRSRPLCGVAELGEPGLGASLRPRSGTSVPCVREGQTRLCRLLPVWVCCACYRSAGGRRDGRHGVNAMWLPPRNAARLRRAWEDAARIVAFERPCWQRHRYCLQTAGGQPSMPIKAHSRRRRPIALRYRSVEPQGYAGSSHAGRGARHTPAPASAAPCPVIAAQWACAASGVAALQRA